MKTREVKNVNTFYTSTDKTRCECSAYVAFNKATDKTRCECSAYVAFNKVAHGQR